MTEEQEARNLAAIATLTCGDIDYPGVVTVEKFSRIFCFGYVNGPLGYDIYETFDSFQMGIVAHSEEAPSDDLTENLEWVIEKLRILSYV